MGTKPGRITGYGKPVLTHETTGPLPRLRLFHIPLRNGGTRDILIRDGSIGFNLALIACRWDQKIHALNAPGDKFDEWGYLDKDIEGSHTTSEHAGGVAIDLDATRHPRGVPVLRNLTVVQTRRINGWLKEMDYVIGWGGNYRHIPDGMHFEAADGKSLASHERVARKHMTYPNGRRLLNANPGLREAIIS